MYTCINTRTHRNKAQPRLVVQDSSHCSTFELKRGEIMVKAVYLKVDVSIQTREHTFPDTYSIIPQKIGSKFTEIFNRIVTRKLYNSK